MKSGKLWIIVLTITLLVVTASAFTFKEAPASIRIGSAAPPKHPATTFLTTPATAPPYYALCNDKSHGYGCAGKETWCGPERNDYASAKADADAHKKENPSHQVTVYYVK